jgi:hypothetical protein
MGGSTGSGGNGGGGGSGGSGGATGSGGTGGATGTGGSGSGTCPADATFCTGFEEASGPPSGATALAYNPNLTFADFLMLDPNFKNSGGQSLQVPPGAGAVGAYKMLAVPVPGPTFWVRLYFRSDMTFGGTEHNTIMQAMNVTGAAKGVEVAEQFCQVLLNDNDSAIYPPGLSGCSTTGPVLSANQWHCVEAFYDGVNGNVQIYADNNKIIDAEGWTPSKATFTNFQFGFIEYHGPDRTIWYDDVVVAASRVGCP